MDVTVTGSDQTSSVSLFVRAQSPPPSDASAWLPVHAFDVGTTITAATSSFSGLAEGLHVFEVRAIDAAGNEQPPPYQTVSTTVDTTPPVATPYVLSSVPPFTSSGSAAVAAAAAAVTVVYSNNSTALICAAVVDSSPTVAAITVTESTSAAPAMTTRSVPVTPTSSGSLYCGSTRVAHDGNYTATATATDSAGNVSPAAVTWVLYDSTPPNHTYELLPTPGCVSFGGVRSCNASMLAAFAVRCVDDAVPSTASPCRVQWSLESFSSFANCDSSASRSPLTWNAVVGGSVDVTPLVPARLAVSPGSRFVWHARAVVGRRAA